FCLSPQRRMRLKGNRIPLYSKDSFKNTETSETSSRPLKIPAIDQFSFHPSILGHRRSFSGTTTRCKSGKLASGGPDIAPQRSGFRSHAIKNYIVAVETTGGIVRDAGLTPE